MVYNGAVGDTQAAMAKVLGLKGLSRDELNAANAQLLPALEHAEPSATLHLANSVWTQTGKPFSHQFLDLCGRFYGAHAEELDLSSARGPRAVNAWVRKETKGKIDEIMDQGAMREGTTLVLVNAAYLDACWREPFQEADSRPGEFTLADGTRKSVTMMQREASLRYAKGTGFQAVALPYGYGRLSLYALLPDREGSLASLLSHLGPDEVSGLAKAMQGETVRLSLPRFRVESALNLSGALKDMGMGVAFDAGRARFDDLVPEPRPIWIDEVRHKTFLKLDERGTEAGAATAVPMTEGAMPAERIPPIEMTFDRPFLLAIRHESSGALLFLGAISDPQAL